MSQIRLPGTIVFAGLLAAGIGIVGAQTSGIDWNPRSGDAWVDTWLGDMNRYGTRYPEPFIDEMVRYHAAPRDLVSELLVDRRWAPGDVYYACALAQVIDRPCRDVVDEWTENHAQGWGAIARRLGVAPGSAGFHRLKNGFVPTYERWARPIVLDADLRRAYPNHDTAVEHGDAAPVHATRDGGAGKAKAATPSQAPGNGAAARNPQGTKGGKPPPKSGQGSGKGNGKH